MYMMYMFRQHYIVPERTLLSGMSHVVLAFMPLRSSTPRVPSDSEWPVFAAAEAVWSQFATNTVIIEDIGQWVAGAASREAVDGDLHERESDG